MRESKTMTERDRSCTRATYPLADARMTSARRKQRGNRSPRNWKATAHQSSSLPGAYRNLRSGLMVDDEHLTAGSSSATVSVSGQHALLQTAVKSSRIRIGLSNSRRRHVRCYAHRRSGKYASHSVRSRIVQCGIRSPGLAGLDRRQLLHDERSAALAGRPGQACARFICRAQSHLSPARADPSSLYVDCQWYINLGMVLCSLAGCGVASAMG